MSGHGTGPIEALRRDLDHYREVGNGDSTLRLLLTQQGLWALVEFRLAAASLAMPAPRFAKRVLQAAFGVWRKAVEISTGISLSPEAQIGDGLYIGHFGGIMIHPEARIGEHCAVMQGVTIGMSWGKAGNGAPVIGDRVYIGPKATVCGPITVGSGSVIAANSLVTRDVAPGVMVRGVPAHPVGEDCSAEADAVGGAKAATLDLVVSREERLACGGQRR
jgi:serine O-acetyltransferase